jgi:hypothetical protein
MAENKVGNPVTTRADGEIHKMASKNFGPNIYLTLVEGHGDIRCRRPTMVNAAANDAG